MSSDPLQPVAGSSDMGVLVFTPTETEVQGAAVAAFERQLHRATSGPETRNVVVDCRNVRVFSSAALRPLLKLRRRLGDRGGRAVLCNLCPAVAESFRNTRMLSISRASPSSTFEVLPSLAAAVASFEQSSQGAGRN